ncbi:hypothetical protein KA005_10815, partial [bacterium]|nr:hypothetical protein [bacterium]
TKITASTTLDGNFGFSRDYFNLPDVYYFSARNKPLLFGLGILCRHLCFTHWFPEYPTHLSYHKLFLLCVSVL